MHKTENGTFIDGENFKQMFKNTPKVRKIFFGRKDLKSKNLFEEILSNLKLHGGVWGKNFAEIFSYIWSEFRLWEIPEIWTMVII
jgi:hypothetical protein